MKKLHLPFTTGVVATVWLLSLATMPVAATEARLAVDFGHVTKAGVNARAAGLNICWLLDSDLRRQQPTAMTQALAEMQVGILRFPYGHLADNYLWHTPPFADTQGGLRPRVASMSEAPGKWTWAVKPDGSMPSAMDFDEYIALCEKLGAMPLVCVNVLSFKYPGGPTYQELKTSAVAWVKYAKRRNYRVACWQIGNEVEHKENGRLLPMDEYVSLYEDFARAMKVVDPAAKISPGILASPAYYNAIAQRCPHLVDFASVHQYVWAWQKACPDYVGWRDCTDTFVSNVERAAKVLTEAGLPHVKLLVTETGVSGGAGLGQVNNTYKALWCFEVLMNELAHPSVAYSFYWGTHTPWDYRGDGEEPDKDVAVALRLRTNARTPTGEIIRLINGDLLDEFVVMERVQGRLRCYAMRSHDGRQRTLFLVNKDGQPADVAIRLGPVANWKVTQTREFVGLSPDDVTPVVRECTPPTFREGALHSTLPSLSVTVVRLQE